MADFEYERGFRVEPLDQRFNPKGDITKIWQHHCSVKDGAPREIYTSSVKQNQFKGWKLHKQMTMRLCVVVGVIRFYFISENSALEIVVSSEKPQLITVPPLIWFGFENTVKDTSVLLNFPNLCHDPAESITVTSKEEIYF